MDLTVIRETVFSPMLLWIIWALVLVAWIIMTAILVYHWNSYSASDPRVRRAKIIYFALSILLFASATTFIFSF